MNDQFFGKAFRVMLAGLAGVFLLAALAFQTPFAGVLTVLCGIAAFALTWRRVEWGLAFALAELFGNSHGHLSDLFVGGFALGMRMAVFLGVMSAWALITILPLVPTRGRLWARGGLEQGVQLWHDQRLLAFLPLFAAVAIGFAIGFAQNPARLAFADGNGYLYLGYVLPFLSVRWDDVKRRLMLQALAAGAIWMCVLTLGLHLAFTHVPRAALSGVYTFIRDTRTGELTDMGGVFRIFLQGQFSAVVLFLLLAVPSWLKDGARAFFATSLLWATILISLSRSFWVGLIAAAVAMITLLIWSKSFGLKRWAKAVGMQTLAAVSGMVLLVAIAFVPLPGFSTNLTSFSDLFASRTTDIGDVAISSRWNLLPEMVTEIKEAPVLGKGFGEEVTFKTDDPRARAINPDGTWTTYAFEWGWLDVWLKMGLIGPLAFLFLFVFLARGLWPMLATDRKWLGIGFLASLTCLAVINVFTPYLNHPLGLGLLILMLPFMTERPLRISPLGGEVKRGLDQVPVTPPVLAAE